MAIGGIGNLTYINQASSVTSGIQASNMPQAIPVNMSLFAQQLQKIEATRPAEHASKVSEDERQKDSPKRESTNSGRKDDSPITESTMLLKPDERILDVKG